MPLAHPVPQPATQWHDVLGGPIWVAQSGWPNLGGPSGVGRPGAVVRAAKLKTPTTAIHSVHLSMIDDLKLNPGWEFGLEGPQVIANGLGVADAGRKQRHTIGGGGDALSGKS